MVLVALGLSSFVPYQLVEALFVANWTLAAVVAEPVGPVYACLVRPGDPDALRDGGDGDVGDENEVPEPK